MLKLRSASIYSSAVLESLGDDSPMEERKENFHKADTDNDGWITYDEFLSVLKYKYYQVLHEPVLGRKLL